MMWDERDAFDETSYRANVQRLIHARVHGVYTTGSTGEFYAIDFDDFRRMVDVQAELCRPAGMPLQIGCCADATRKTLRLLEYVAGIAAVGAAQVVIPYWMELSDRELMQFFKDISRAFPDLPIVHYNVPRAKRFLQGPDYQRLLDVAPNLIGVKYTFASAHFAQLQDAVRLTPNLSYFVGEPLLASAMQFGVRGTYSSLVLVSPRFMLDYYDAAAAKHWDEAMQTQERIARFFAELKEHVTALGEGWIDPVVDKGLGLAAGFLTGHPRCRAPHIGWSEATVASVARVLRENYPELVYNP